MFPYARIGLLCFIILGGCVLALFLFPTPTGPFSAVNGPAAEMRSAHNGLLLIGIVRCALNKPACELVKSCCTPTSSVASQMSFESPRILNC